MKLYKFKALNCGFVIICTDCNVGQIKTTVNSIKCNYPDSKYICVLPSECHKDDQKIINTVCKSYTGGSTITSLINVGMKNTPCNEWNFIVMGGTWVKNGLSKKYSYFIDSEKDILFPIVDRKTNFIDGSINGILWHKKTYESIEPLSNDNPLEICKLMFTMGAIEKGCKFKAVLGAQIC